MHKLCSALFFITESSLHIGESKVSITSSLTVFLQELI